MVLTEPVPRKLFRFKTRQRCQNLFHMSTHDDETFLVFRRSG